MRLLNTLLVLMVVTRTTSHLAAEPDESAVPRRDQTYNTIDLACRSRFPGATLIKVDRREKEGRDGDIFILSWGFSGSKNEVLYKLTLSDTLNKKFDVVFNSHAELLATEKYKTTFDALPKAVQAAIEAKAPNSSGSPDALDARLEHGVYKVSGKINGKKVNVEVNVGVIAPPEQIATLKKEAEKRAADEKPADVVSLDRPVVRSGKPEIAARVDGPFRAMFPDATVIHVDHKDSTNVTIHVFSIGGGDSKYELTLSDPLNKKFKVVYSDTGHLMSATTFIAPFERLPREVQKAVEQLAPVVDPNETLEVRVDHKSLSQTEHEEYKISGKVNGVKISVEVPIYGTH